MYFGEVWQRSIARAVSEHKLLGDRASFLGGWLPKSPIPLTGKKPNPYNTKKIYGTKKNTLCATIAENKFVEEKTHEF
jgi:hypothetical protein